MKSKRAFMLFVTVLWIIAGITLIITLNQEDEEAVVETFGQINCEKADFILRAHWKKIILHAMNRHNCLKIWQNR